jgi:hypothetical protein
MCSFYLSVGSGHVGTGLVCVCVCVCVFICLWPSLSIHTYSSICVCLCVASFPLSVSLGVTDRLVGGPHASLDYNSIGAEGAKHVGAVLGECPNLTHVKYVCRCS